jgi:hypothetical protein
LYILVDARLYVLVAWSKFVAIYLVLPSQS